jgi:hypothetical protein
VCHGEHYASPSGDPETAGLCRGWPFDGAWPIGPGRLLAAMQQRVSPYRAEDPTEFWSGVGGEWASLAARPRSAVSDGCPRNPPKNGGASLPPRPPQENRQMCVRHGRAFPWCTFSSSFAPPLARLRPCCLRPRCEAVDWPLWSYEVLRNCASRAMAASGLYKRGLRRCARGAAI